jgi:hypothetical protein
MPLTSFQSAVLNRLAASRSPDSYIAGGIAINRNGPRISNDIDIFHDSESRLDAAVAADEAALGGGGYTVTWPPGQRTGKRAAIIEKDGERVLLEWVTDAQFRFFPTQKDSLFGYVLHPADLAANKAAAAADRRAPRDIVDLVTIHQTILPLGAVVAAAVGKFPGTTPEEMLAEITRHSRFTAEEFNALAMDKPIDIPGLHARIRDMLAAAERFVTQLPSDAVGALFLERGQPVQPDLTRLADYQRHTGAPSGIWPPSSEISSAMLERYDKR